MTRLVCDMDECFQSAFIRNERRLFKLRKEFSLLCRLLNERAGDAGSEVYLRAASRLVRVVRLHKSLCHRHDALKLRLLERRAI